MFRLIAASRGNTICSIASSRLVAVADTQSIGAASSYFPSLHQHRRQFSSSHDDFAPKKKHNLDDNENESEKIKNLIDSHVKSNHIMLYMKGSPSQPMVRF
jgi:hypothetical protein